MNILVRGTHSVARWLMLGISDLEHASVQYHTGSMSVPNTAMNRAK